MKIIRANDEYGDYCLIPLWSKGEIIDYTMVSPEDYEWAMQWDWGISGKRYTYRYAYINGERQCIFLHREVLEKRKLENITELMGDHINRKTLDNRRKNLRPATASQNCINRTFSHKNPRELRGVKRRGEYYRVQIRDPETKVNGDSKQLEWQFIEKEVAITVYDLAAIKYHKDFAVLNRTQPGIYDGMDLDSFLNDYKLGRYTSMYNGVCIAPKNLGWKAQVQHNRKSIKIKGCFDEEIEAAIAWDLKILEMFGPNTTRNLNFGLESYPNMQYKGMNLEQFLEICTMKRRIRQANELLKNKPVKYHGVFNKHKKFIGSVGRDYKEYKTQSHVDPTIVAVEVDKLRLQIWQEEAIPKLNFPLSNYMELVDEFNLHKWLKVEELVSSII